MHTEQVEKIYFDFNGKLIGKKQIRWEICEALSMLPQNIVDYVTENCWFVSSLDDAWAFAFEGSDLQNKYLIFLSDDLFLQTMTQIHWTVIHEVGHIMLGHKNSTLSKQSKEEITKQEKEADAFTKQYTPTPY